MIIEEDVYRELQRHLDRQAIGFPSSKSGAEIRILKALFSPEEARLALHLTFRPASLERICESAGTGGIPRERVEAMLGAMVGNGAIEHAEREGTHYFWTMPLIVGMFEYQVGRLTPEFLSDVGEYMSDRAYGLSFLGTQRPQMRTIPVGKSIAPELNVATYDQAVEIIKAAEGPFAIIECICRKSAAMGGKPCRKTSRQETCMPIGYMARHAVEIGAGRSIGREEALEIAAMNEAEGLVFQPSNAQKADFLCSCCGCCCGMLRFQKMLPRPLEYWAANYYAAVDAGACTGCGSCVKRCQVDAVKIDAREKAAAVNLGRCIGCGNCVVACPAGAMSLRKTRRETVPPPDMEALNEEIMARKKGTLGRMALIAKLMLRR